MGAFLEFLEPSIAFEVFVEKLTLVFHLFNILCTLSKRLGVGFLFHSDGVQFGPKTIGCIEGFLWSYSDL